MAVSKVTTAVLTVAALVAMNGPAVGATHSFAPYEVYGLGASVLSSAVADVTGDGRPDAILTTGSSIDPANADKLIVLPQREDGTLGPAIKHDTFAEPYDLLGVTTGDLNRDGRMDVAVATSHGIEMHYGRVGGGLGAAEYPNNTPAERVVITQLDGGGPPEMVSWGEGGIHVLRKDAAWNIWWSTRITTMDPTDVEVGDVTGDGRPDLIGVLTTFSVFPQLPGGGFGGSVAYVANPASTGRGAELALGDLNGDGRNDVVQSIPYTSLSADLYVFLQTPTGELAGPTTYTSSGETDSIEIADLDRDGRNDLVGVHRSTGRVGVWYRGMELGEVTHETVASTWSVSDNLALGDVNGDGQSDLVIADPSNGLVVVRSIPDTDPPETAMTGWPGGTSADGTATFSFAADEAGSFTCSLNGSSGPCSSPHAYTGLPDADYSFTVVATDPSGNVDPSPAGHTFTVEARAPETTITSGPTGAIASTSAIFSFASDEAVDHFECSLGGAPFASCPSPQTYAELANGTYEFQVRAVDRALNRDETPAVRTFIVDTQAPQTTITAGPSGTVTSSSATFSFVADEQAASFECSFQGAAFTSCPSPMTYAGLGDGVYEFRVRAVDPALNRDATPAVRTFTVTLPSDLEVVMSATPQPVAPKGQLTYTMTVTNRGPAASSAVKVVHSLPAKSTFVSMSTAAGSCTKAGTPVKVTCDLGTLPAGSSTTITVVVKVTAAKGATLASNAVVSGPRADPNLANNTASVSTPVR
jgi:uncharacterized repeat protein (TIGR01451 family)